MLDLNVLKKVQEEYKTIQNTIQQYKGEEISLLKEKERLLVEIKKLGFNSIDELMAHLKTLEEQIIALDKELLNVIKQ